MVITKEQIKQLYPIIPNLIELIQRDDFDELQTLLDIAIVNALTGDYEATPRSRELQKLYDELYDQN